MVKFELDSFVESIVTLIPTCKAKKSERFNEYIISKLTDNDLVTTLGFTFIGKDLLNTKPLYQKENLEGFFEDQLFHIYTII